MTKKQKKLLQRITAAAVLFSAGMLLPLFAEVPAYIIFALFGISYIIIGWDIIWKAFCNIRQGEAFDENFLMTVATTGAFALGEYSEGVAVMLFYQIGEWFQSYAVSRSRQSITALMDIRPDYANVERNGELVQVDPDEVAVGEIITVKPGERVPIDGEIISGRSALDTSALTGESLPREVEEGMEVISGCINQTGILKIKTTKEFGESTVAKILDLVENSSEKKARSENFITRFAKFYTPIVVFAALLLATIAAMYLLGTRHGYNNAQLEKIMTKSLEPTGMILLVTACGGVLRYMLQNSGLGDVIGNAVANASLPRHWRRFQMRRAG